MFSKKKDREIAQLKAELFEVKEQLHNTQSLFNALIERSLAGYWDWNIVNNTEYLSPTFKKMFGYEDHEMENTPEAWQKLVYPEDIPILEASLNEHFASKGTKPYVTEIRYFHKDGSIVWIYCLGEVISWSTEGQPTRMVGCHMDITNLKNIQEELKAKAFAIEGANKELEDFAYVASHDLIEPINTISGFNDRLRRNYYNILDERGQQSLDFIDEAIQHQRSLIKDLLEHARLGTNKPIETVPLYETLEEVKNILHHKIIAKNVTISSNPLPTIVGFKTELRLLFQNLISNAIKFSKKDVAPIIDIKCSKLSDKIWQFEFKDNGIGIDQKYFDRIFVQFKKAHGSDEYTGSGIGLSHCVKIVHLHEGNISVRSKLGEGSTFTFTLKNKR